VLDTGGGLVERTILDLLGSPGTERTEFGRGNQGLVTGCKGITETVKVLHRLGMARANHDAILDGNHTDGTEEERTGAVLLAEKATVVECLGGSGVLTEDLVAVPFLVKDNVLKRTGDILLLDPVERPVASVLQRRDKAGGMKPGHRRSASMVEGSRTGLNNRSLTPFVPERNP
jgi:hypothetical protein